METLVLRPTALVRGAFDALGILFAGGVVYGVVTGNADWSVTVVIAMVVAGLVGLNRNRLVVSDNELVSCGGYKTRRWPKSEVRQFVLLRQGLIGRAVAVVLADGSSVTLAGAAFIGGGRDAADLQARLGSWLAAEPSA